MYSQNGLHANGKRKEMKNKLARNSNNNTNKGEKTRFKKNIGEKERERKKTQSKNIYKKKQSNINNAYVKTKIIFCEERVHILQKRNPNIGISIAYKHFLLPGRQPISLTFSQPIRRHISFFLCFSSARRMNEMKK